MTPPIFILLSQKSGLFGGFASVVKKVPQSQKRAVDTAKDPELYAAHVAALLRRAFERHLLFLKSRVITRFSGNRASLILLFDRLKTRKRNVDGGVLAG